MLTVTSSKDSKDSKINVVNMCVGDKATAEKSVFFSVGLANKD